MTKKTYDFNSIYFEDRQGKRHASPPAEAQRKSRTRREIEWYLECREAGIEYQPLSPEKRQ